MAAFETTSPDSIAKLTNAGPADLVIQSQTQGDSVQAAFSKRMRYTYVWPTSSERTAQTGMVQGSTGYQVDTKTEYIYDNSNWRLALSYGEYSDSGQSIANATEVTLTGMTNVSAATTDTVFVTVNSGTGVITIVTPGIYALSLTVGMASSSLGSTNYAALRPDNTGTLPPLSLSGFNAGAATVALPFLRTTISNYVIYPRMYHTNGASVAVSYAILRVGRLG